MTHFSARTEVSASRASRLVSAECEERSWTLRPVSGLSEVFVTVPLTTTGCFAVR